mmetsp:Transcript_11490/g.34629  ORF Transcript_11490/g.34629 Transcript_11490/m.34629 type:complete len:118 (+) Transcript_11490:260-613(+)
MQPSQVARAALTLVGRVVSNREMEKTAKVVVTRLAEHPKVKRTIKLRKTYLVHDEAGERLPGDVVQIRSCPRYSKRKSFEIVDIIQEAPRFTDPRTGQTLTPYSETTRKIPTKRKKK